MTKRRSSGKEYPCGRRTSLILFEATQGTRYFIAVTGYAGTAGHFTLTLHLTPPAGSSPVNDAFARRIPLDGILSWVEASNVGATAEAGEPWVSVNAARATVWWSWRSPGWGRAYLRIHAGGFNARAAVFSGSSVTNLQTIATTAASTKPNELEFDATGNTDYEIAVDGTGADTGAFLFVLSAPAMQPPPQVALAFENPPGTLTLTYTGYTTGTVILLGSTNLLDWQPLLTNQLAPGSPLLLPPLDSPSGFYQLRLP
ncbi:MAG TPA: hypothetical protein PKM73_11070 [Verrucomicrobiota bacterium]|nr:hypothetical protein [Verrucomicrobiota bacterium]HNU50285.1 hypothetical protein [Verrucomicrobiota bacterium]